MLRDSWDNLCPHYVTLTLTVKNSNLTLVPTNKPLLTTPPSLRII
jgi:hypothetical protein